MERHPARAILASATSEMMSKLNRRQFLHQSGGAALTTLGGTMAFSGLADGGPVPIRTIYSNDTTHILSCQRPEERVDEFSEALLQKSITEAAGVDAHFLQPGLGWIPWWDSQIYPMEAHYRWLHDEYGIKGQRKVDRFVLQGGDLLRTLVGTCREIGVAPFLSFRLNDGHHVRDLKEALEKGRPTQTMARHYWDNYERFRLGPDVSNWNDGVFDWSIAEVRDYKFALIEEACRHYDLAGLELDFLRHWRRFGDNTSPDERFSITTQFIRRVRSMLDVTAAERGLPRRLLCIRVPANAAVRPEQGVDLKALAAVGVDMINLSYSYFTWQNDSVARAKEEVGDSAAVYAEMTHCTMTGKATAGSGTQPFLRTTDEQFYTTARITYEQGATGVSLFNFPYYRYHVTDTIGPFHEPPFHVLPKLKNEVFLKQQPVSLFLSSGRNDEILGQKPLPAILNRDHPATFEMLAPGVSSNHKGGLLRMRSRESISDRVVEMKLNGTLLEPIATELMPLPHPYENTWLGKPDEILCFEIPHGFPVLSRNTIKITVKRGIRVPLIYLDLSIE